MALSDRELLERAIVVLEMTVDTRRCSIAVQRTMNDIRARLAEPEDDPQDFNRVPLKTIRRGTVQWNTAETKLRCGVCGRDQTQIRGYVCARPDCPTRVTV